MTQNHNDRKNDLIPGSPDISRRGFIKGLAAAGAAGAFPLVITSRKAGAAEWPSRPITTVVMYSAGGGTDTVLRTITHDMAQQTGWTINVINKPGAVGGVATRFMLNKRANGYWWLGAANYNKFVRVMGHSDTVAWRDWQYFQGGNSLASWSVRPDSPYKTLEDVIAAAKKRPGKISISTSGVGGLWHELAAIVSLAAGIELKFIPYKGGRPATLAGLQGEVDITGGGVHEHIEFIRAGKLRNLQQTGASDIKVPGGPTLRSVGSIIPALKPMLPLSGIYNLALKRETPLEILEMIKKAWIKGVNGEGFKKIAKRKYFEIDIRTGEAADRRAALVECITASTFLKVQKMIGKKIRGPKELGLPEPEDFAAWWPPKGYKPRMS
ncbi:MAG: tripartite tricarboxylate transporter substrate binding protein [bacterium]